MGTLITLLLAVLIFGIGLTSFFKAVKKEVVEGKCAGCAGCGKERSCKVANKL